MSKNVSACLRMSQHFTACFSMSRQISACLTNLSIIYIQLLLSQHISECFGNLSILYSQSLFVSAFFNVSRHVYARLSTSQRRQNIPKATYSKPQKCPIAGDPLFRPLNNPKNGAILARFNYCHCILGLVIDYEAPFFPGEPCIFMVPHKCHSNVIGYCVK